VVHAGEHTQVLGPGPQGTHLLPGQGRADAGEPLAAVHLLGSEVRGGGVRGQGGGDGELEACEQALLGEGCVPCLAALAVLTAEAGQQQGLGHLVKKGEEGGGGR
jgi:hypothetical protein